MQGAWGREQGNTKAISNKEQGARKQNVISYISLRVCAFARNNSIVKRNREYPTIALSLPLHFAVRNIYLTAQLKKRKS